MCLDFGTICFLVMFSVMLHLFLCLIVFFFVLMDLVVLDHHDSRSFVIVVLCGEALYCFVAVTFGRFVVSSIVSYFI